MHILRKMQYKTDGRYTYMYRPFALYRIEITTQDVIWVIVQGLISEQCKPITDF